MASSQRRAASGVVRAEALGEEAGEMGETFAARAAEVGREVLVVLLVVLAFAIAGTLDHPEELRHERWLAEAEASGAAVIR